MYFVTYIDDHEFLLSKAFYLGFTVLCLFLHLHEQGPYGVFNILFSPFNVQNPSFSCEQKNP